MCFFSGTPNCSDWRLNLVFVLSILWINLLIYRLPPLPPTPLKLSSVSFAEYASLCDLVRFRFLRIRHGCVWVGTVAQVDPVCVWVIILLCFGSEHHMGMYGRWGMHISIKARFKRIWFQGLALIRDSWFLDKSRNLIACVSADPVDSGEYRFVWILWSRVLARPWYAQRMRQRI